MMVCKKDVAKAAASLQLSAGQDVGAEAAIHTMWHIFADADTDAALMIDAENAFNFINRKVMLRIIWNLFTSSLLLT